MTGLLMSNNRVSMSNHLISLNKRQDSPDSGPIADPTEGKMTDKRGRVEVTLRLRRLSSRGVNGNNRERPLKPRRTQLSDPVLKRAR